MLHQRKSCSNCINGTTIPINNDILCREKGAVTSDYVCSKHRYIPITKSLLNTFKCINCENYIFSSGAPENNPALDNISTIGLCRLFSVRQFDGTRKNACSKFEKRSQREVS